MEPQISRRAGWWLFAVVFGGVALLAVLDLADGQFYHHRQDVTTR